MVKRKIYVVLCEGFCIKRLWNIVCDEKGKKKPVYPMVEHTGLQIGNITLVGGIIPTGNQGIHWSRFDR